MHQGNIVLPFNSEGMYRGSCHGRRPAVDRDLQIAVTIGHYAGVLLLSPPLFHPGFVQDLLCLRGRGRPSVTTSSPLRPCLMAWRIASALGDDRGPRQFSLCRNAFLQERIEFFFANGREGSCRFESRSGQKLPRRSFRIRDVLVTPVARAVEERSVRYLFGSLEMNLVKPRKPAGLCA